VHDLAIIIVSTNEARWLTPCLSSIYSAAGDISLDVVIADNESTDGTRELVEREFPQARVVTCPNRGFAHANNRGFFATDARYVLFLNPDTEILEGTLEKLVLTMDARPEVGLAGVKQKTPTGAVFPTIRRFPTVARYFLEAIGSEKLPFRASFLGERELDMAKYEAETACDWTSGSFMITRREAIDSAGLMDERFFIFSEEVDFCLRIRQAGWEIRHLPHLTILHHADKVGYSPRTTAQEAFARRQYLRKHFGPASRAAALVAIGLRRAPSGSWPAIARRRAEPAGRRARSAASAKRSRRISVWAAAPPSRRTECAECPFGCNTVDRSASHRVGFGIWRTQSASMSRSNRSTSSS
jgi:N-acetylglucosaminyl-diphospho-decaprenol L-rhamnosyltransferase